MILVIIFEVRSSLRLPVTLWGLCEVGAFKAQMFNKSQMLIRITNVQILDFCPNFTKPLLADALMSVRSCVGANLQSPVRWVKSKFEKNCGGFFLGGKKHSQKKNACSIGLQRFSRVFFLLAGFQLINLHE